MDVTFTITNYMGKYIYTLMFAYFLLKCIMIVLIQRIKLCAGEFKCKKGCENCVGKIFLETYT